MDASIYSLISSWHLPCSYPAKIAWLKTICVVKRVSLTSYRQGIDGKAVVAAGSGNKQAWRKPA